MAAISVRGHVLPNAIQPPLADGIHLRWAFEREYGFPWFGYLLYRRLSHSADATLRRFDLTGIVPGSLGASTLQPSGDEVRSNATLAATDDFPPS
jgi:hypothetical protein